MLLGKKGIPIMFRGYTLFKNWVYPISLEGISVFLPGILKVGLNGMSVGWDEKVARISSMWIPSLCFTGYLSGL